MLYSLDYLKVVTHAVSEKQKAFTPLHVSMEELNTMLNTEISFMYHAQRKPNVTQYTACLNRIVCLQKYYESNKQYKLRLY